MSWNWNVAVVMRNRAKLWCLLLPGSSVGTFRYVLQLDMRS